MKNKQGCDTKVRILALERILQGTNKPLSTEEIMEILEKQYRSHGNRHTFGDDIKALRVFIDVKFKHKHGFWIGKSEAEEKQIPKKPHDTEGGMFFTCPNCRRFLTRREHAHGNIDIPYCKWCGQRLDWEEENENA